MFLRNHDVMDAAFNVAQYSLPLTFTQVMRKSIRLNATCIEHKSCHLLYIKLELEGTNN